MREVPISCLLVLEAKFSIDAVWFLHGRPSYSIPDRLEELAELDRTIETDIRERNIAIAPVRRAKVLALGYEKILAGQKPETADLRTWINLVCDTPGDAS